MGTVDILVTRYPLAVLVFAVLVVFIVLEVRNAVRGRDAELHPRRDTILAGIGLLAIAVLLAVGGEGLGR